MKVQWLCIGALFCFSGIYAQNRPAKKDSLVKEIKEVVITGQYSPQSINRSIYKVEVISSEDIKRMNANNAAEVLNQNLNLLIIPDSSSGNSNVSIMGLGSEYTKILIDNIPVVGDNGVGNMIDLTKLTLENVERIEIVKGAMGVEYGNNAMAGVINIITKKSANDKKISVNGFLQEETVGKEYDWYKKGEGRHIQGLNLHSKLSDKLTLSAYINHNDFQGFKGEQKGYMHAILDQKRGYDWQPKDQISTGATLHFNSGKAKMFYKFDYLNEEINFRSPSMRTRSLGTGGERTYVAIDRDYFTNRFLHHFNIMTPIGSRVFYMGDFSYQKQDRQFANYEYDVPARQEIKRYDKQSYLKTETLYSKGTFSNLLSSNTFNLMAGYEADFVKGYANSMAAEVISFGNMNNLNKETLNAAAFVSSETKIADEWSLRTGFRANFSNKYDPLMNYSLTAKYRINERSDFRAVVGTAHRYPTFTELYTYFVDANHDIRGNENLKAETGYSGSLIWNYKSNASNRDFRWGVDLSTVYLQVNNRIDLAIVQRQPLRYEYININQFQSWLNSFSGKLTYKNLTLNAGASIMGVSQYIDENSAAYNNMRYRAEINSSLYYTFPKWNTQLSLFHKYTGKITEFVKDNDTNETYRLGERQGFHLMHFTASQPFWKNRLELSLGIRNIFDVTEIESTLAAGDAHSAGPNKIKLMYGRSYFAKLKFNF